MDDMRKFNELSALLLKDDRKQMIINYYYGENMVYLDHIIKAIKIVKYAEKNKKRAFNTIKTTRAGFTTNCLLACLFLDMKVLIVEPTNAIGYDTVREIMELYVKVTGDKSKIVRAIPSNKDGCSEVVQKLEENEIFGMLPYVLGGNCDECEEYGVFATGMFLPKATTNNCTIKTMMYEKSVLQDGYRPDVLTVTYDKLLTLGGNGTRASFFSGLIAGVDVVVFDEIGHYFTKVESGLEIKNERRIAGVFHTHTLAERVEELEEFVEEIENDYYKSRFKFLINGFVKPFMEGTIDEVLKEGEFPRFYKNCLSEQMIEVVVKRGKSKKKEMMIKTDAIGEIFMELYDMLEDVLEEEEGVKMVELLLELLGVMSSRELVAYSSGGIEFVGEEEVEVKFVNVSATMDELIEKLEKWISKKQVTIFTDATMPAYSFHHFKKKGVVDILFGDPAGTNDSTLIARDDDIGSFGVRRWNLDEKFRSQILSRVKEIVDMVGGQNVVVWCPNKGIYMQMMDVFREAGYGVCNHEAEDKTAIQFTYYNSVMTRGVNSKRRVQVMVGKANKPRGSFKHIAFMQRLQWDVFDNKEIERIAWMNGLEVDEYKDMIDRWSREFKYEGEMIRCNKIPDIIKNYFGYYADAIQKEKTYCDTWQAGSRAKDSMAQELSMIYCLGWRDDEVWEMLKWGGMKNTKYRVRYGDVVRTSQKQMTVIRPPQVMSIKGEYLDDIVGWLQHGLLIPEVVGFGVDLQSGIMNMLMYEDKVNSEDIWMNLSRNLGVGDDSEDWRNGYLVGVIRAFMKYNAFTGDIGVREMSVGEFEFKRNEEREPEIVKELTLYELEIVVQVLRAMYLVKKNKVTYSDVRNRIGVRRDVYGKGLGNNEIEMALNLVMGHDLLRGSSWRLEIRHKGDKKRYRMFKGVEKSVETRRMQKLMMEHGLEYVRRLVIKAVFDWYDGEESLELSPHSLQMLVPGVGGEQIEEVLRFVMEKDVLRDFGLPCEVIEEEVGLCVVRNLARV